MSRSWAQAAMTTGFLSVEAMEQASVLCAAVIVAASVVVSDGRCLTKSRQNVYAFQNDKWGQVKENAQSEGWFRRNLRCSRSTYETIVQRVADKWCYVHERLHHNTVFGIDDRVAMALLHHNTVFGIDDRVAMALQYLTHADGYDPTAEIFGISKTRAYMYVCQVVLFVNKCFLSRTVRLPNDSAEWEEIRRGFEMKAGFPNCYGALDGSLIPIKRFADFDGWYCRKGFPAFNMQAVVDDKLRFRSYSLRSGSQNDKSLFNHSRFGRTCHKVVPVGDCFVGDTGYKLYEHIMTPYPILSHMSDEDRAVLRFVEDTFRIHQTVFLHDTPEQMAALITCTLVLHNWFIDLDDYEVDDDDTTNKENWMYIGGDDIYPHELHLIDGEQAESARSKIRDYLFKNVDID
ncbi:hypothetical protein Ae201684P_021471 [Aphanomyces euteiches]|nr:hypothetical protein Ae201684P_021471 [Aphanomyces euteiches]KAH9132976.1 hypothetical protein AeRB84_020811 [Aphanomyces euteiches]